MEFPKELKELIEASRKSEYFALKSLSNHMLIFSMNEKMAGRLLAEMQSLVYYLGVSDYKCDKELKEYRGVIKGIDLDLAYEKFMLSVSLEVQDNLLCHYQYGYYSEKYRNLVKENPKIL